MTSVPSRFSTLRSFALLALILDLAGGAAAVGFAIYWAANQRAELALGLGLGGLTALILGVLAYCQVQLLWKFVSNSYRTYDALLDVSELLRRQGDHARTMADNSALSDWAKTIVYREKDYEFLRDTIHGAIVRQDWETAEHLINDLDKELGYREEASRLRDDVIKSRQATIEEKIAAALNRFEMLCSAQKWEQAQRESERLRTLFPTDERMANLPAELDLRKQEYKRRLLRDYDQAAQVHDVDAAHRLLLEIDRYLSPQEAAALKESARGVFKERLEQMRVQFSFAVSDKRFRQAIEIGTKLIREFPNSRYAHEIADKMPVLRQRAERQLKGDGAAVRA